jgi:hypothetical protein
MISAALQGLLGLVTLVAMVAAQESRPGALDFARRALFKAELDQANEERLIAIVAPQGGEFEGAISELMARDSWVLRRRAVRLARWRFGQGYLSEAFARAGWHRDAAWPVREEVWRGACVRSHRELQPFESALDEEEALPVRIAIRLAQATATGFVLRESAREALQRDLEAPDAGLRRAAARVLLNTREDSWALQQMRRRLDDTRLPREHRRLFLTALWEPLDRPDLLPPGPSPSELGPLGSFDWQFRQPRDRAWGESAFALLSEAAALGEDLEKVWCRELAGKVSVEDLFRLGRVPPVLAKLYLASPAGSTPWMESAFLYRLLLRRRGTRLDERFLIEEIRVRLLMPPAQDEAPAPHSPEVVSALRDALDAEGQLDLRSRAALVDLFRRLGKPLSPSELERLSRERSDAMRRAAFAGLLSNPTYADAKLVAMALRWIDGRGPGVWALKRIMRDRPEAGALTTLGEDMIAEGRESPHWSARLSALLQAAGREDLRILRDRHPDLPLESRLLELGDADAWRRRRRQILADHQMGRASPADEILALADDPDSGAQIAGLIPASDSRLEEEPRLAAAALRWHRRERDGGKESAIAFARQLLRRLRKDSAIRFEVRRALCEELGAAMNEEEKILLHSDIYQTAQRWPAVTRSLWEALARLEAEEDGGGLEFPAPTSLKDGRDAQRRRRWVVLRATRGDDEARRDLESSLGELFREAHSIEERAEFIRDLIWARETDLVAWCFLAETEVWRAGRGRHATPDELEVAGYLRELACSADADALNSVLRATHTEGEGDDFCPRRVEAWEKADLESALARQGRGLAYLAELTESLRRRDRVRPFVVSTSHFATRLLRSLQFKREGVGLAERKGVDPSSRIRFLDPSFAGDRDASRGLSRRIRRALGPARWSLAANQRDLNAFSTLSHRVGLVDVEACYRGLFRSRGQPFENFAFVGDAICFGRHPEFGALTTRRGGEARLIWEGNRRFHLAMKIAAQRP